MSQRFKGKFLCSLICKLMFAAATYSIWRERNARICHDRTKHVCNIISVSGCVRARINTLHGFDPSQENRRFQRSQRVSEEMLQKKSSLCRLFELDGVLVVGQLPINLVACILFSMLRYTLVPLYSFSLDIILTLSKIQLVFYKRENIFFKSNAIY